MGAGRAGAGAGAPRPARRLFFALWPDAACRRRLEQEALGALAAGAAQGGRPVPPDDWHVTLCFLGAVPESLLPALQAGAARVRVPGFTLRLQRLRYWAEAGVIAALGDCPPAAAQLAAALRCLSRELGLAPDEQPLRPHITLVRGLRRGSALGRGGAQHTAGAAGPGRAEAPGALTAQTLLDLALVATRFELAESREPVAASAARYHTLAGWPLTG